MASPIQAPDLQTGTGLTLLTVIAELQFIQQFVADDPKNLRIAGLLEQAQLDLAEVASKITHGEDPLVGPDPIQNANRPQG